MDEFIKAKIGHLEDELRQLADLQATTDDLMIEGLIIQEIKRNEGLIEIYRHVLEQYGWAKATA